MVWQKKMYEARLRCRAPVGANTVSHATHDGGKIPRNTVSDRCRVSAKEDHGDERIIAAHKKVYQEVLMHPVDLSQYAPNAIPLHRIVDAAARCKADLQRDVVAECRAWNDSIYDAHTSFRFRRYVGPASVEQRPDEPAALEPMRARKGQAPDRVVPVRGGRCHGL